MSTDFELRAPDPWLDEPLLGGFSVGFAHEWPVVEEEDGTRQMWRILVTLVVGAGALALITKLSPARYEPEVVSRVSIEVPTPKPPRQPPEDQRKPERTKVKLPPLEKVKPVTPPVAEPSEVKVARVPDPVPTPPRTPLAAPERAPESQSKPESTSPAAAPGLRSNRPEAQTSASSQQVVTVRPGGTSGGTVLRSTRVEAPAAGAGTSTAATSAAQKSLIRTALRSKSDRQEAIPSETSGTAAQGAGAAKGGASKKGKSLRSPDAGSGGGSGGGNGGGIAGGGSANTRGPGGSADQGGGGGGGGLRSDGEGGLVSQMQLKGRPASSQGGSSALAIRSATESLRRNWPPKAGPRGAWQVVLDGSGRCLFDPGSQDFICLTLRNNSFFVKVGNLGDRRVRFNTLEGALNQAVEVLR